MSRTAYFLLACGIVIVLTVIGVQARVYCPRPAGTYIVNGVAVNYTTGAAGSFYTTNGADPLVCVRTPATGAPFCPAP